MDTHAATRRDLHLLAVAFFCISVGGLLLHVRIHPPGQTIYNWTPLVFGLVNSFILPVAYCLPRLAPAAFVATVVTVIAGTLGMAYHSVVAMPAEATLWFIFIGSLFCDIIILLAKLFMGLAMVRMAARMAPPASQRGCTRPSDAASAASATGGAHV